jgi:hypothetical protein
VSVELRRAVRSAEGARFAKAQRVFDALSAHARLHEPRRRFAQNNFPVIRHVVRMRVTDEHEFLFRPVRIEPKTKAGKIDSALTILEIERWHAANLEFGKRNFQCVIQAPGRADPNAPARNAVLP